MDKENAEIPISFTGTIVYAEPLSGRKVVDDDVEIYEPDNYDYTINMMDKSISLSDELKNKSGKVVAVVGEGDENNDSYARLPIAGSRSIDSGVVNLEDGTSVNDRYELWATTDDSGRVQLELEPPSRGLKGALSAIFRAILPGISPRSVPDNLKRQVEDRSYNIIDPEIVKSAESTQAEKLQAEEDNLNIGLAVGELVTEKMADRSVKYNVFVIYEYTKESPVDIDVTDEDLSM